MNKENELKFEVVPFPGSLGRAEVRLQFSEDLRDGNFNIKTIWLSREQCKELRRKLKLVTK